MLKDMFAQKGASIYKAARDCGLPYTTLNELVLGKKNMETCSLKTVSALANYFGMTVEAFTACAAGKNSAPPAAAPATWAAAKKKKYRFPTKYTETGFNISRVHPLKQKDAIAVYNAIRQDARVANAVLFGSAPTICCTSKSDLDIAVELEAAHLDRQSRNEVSEAIQEACGYSADIIWMDRVQPESQLSDNISLGVKIK